MFFQLETQLEAHEQEQAQSNRSVRNVDRIVKDLQGQLDRKDKQNGQLQDDVTRMRDKADKLLKTIDELQASESSTELTARRAERELREEREKGLRLERELEGWKSMGSSGSASGGSIAGGSMRRTGTQGTFRSSILGHTASTATTRTTLSTVSSASSATSSAATDPEQSPDIPKRKSSIGRARAPSMTKGFL